MRLAILALAIAGTAAGCARVSESRLNPLDGFGAVRTEVAATPAQNAGPLVPADRQVVVVDGRSLLASVTDLSIDRTPSGAVVRATGIAPTQGFFNAQLVELGFDGGTLELAFRAQPPATPHPQGTPLSRQIAAAYVLGAGEVAAMRAVRVRAAGNALVASR